MTTPTITTTTRTNGFRPFGRKESRRRFAATAVTLLVAVTLALPALPAPVAAQAGINEPPLGGGIVVFPERDFVTLEGYAPNAAATIEVFRNDVRLSHATGTTDQTGFLEVNHPGGECWIGRTPDILPGDKIRVALGGAVDQTTTANVTTGAPIIQGDVVVVHGTADDITRPGLQPLPLANIEQRLINPAFTSGTNGRRLGAPGDGTLAYDPVGPNNPDGINWTATYTEASTQGDLAADIASGAVADAESRILWLGQDPLAEAELTIFETPVDGGPQAPCDAPLARTAITDVDRQIVNIATVRRPLVVSGVAIAETEAVEVSVPGGGQNAATFTDGPTPESGKTWTASIPAAELGALGQGRFVVTAAFRGPGAPNNPGTLALSKDTVAPRAPTATPLPNRYFRSQRVSLESEAGATIRFSTNGFNPAINGRVFGAQIVVTSTQTIQAVAIDAAGNTSTLKAFSYVITKKNPQKNTKKNPKNKSPKKNPKRR